MSDRLTWQKIDDTLWRLELPQVTVEIEQVAGVWFVTAGDWLNKRFDSRHEALAYARTEIPKALRDAARLVEQSEWEEA